MTKKLKWYDYPLGIIALAVIAFVLIFIGTFGGGDKKIPPMHFTFEYADDIKSNVLFDTPSEREAYKQRALKGMEELYHDFYKRFGFQPKHRIHIILSEYVNGGKNSAYAEKSYSYDGTILALSIHFPYEMFTHKWVRAHELTHSFVAPFFLPTWADEGFAVWIENKYADAPQHPIVDLKKDLRLDPNGVNAVQNWTEGRGIYVDFDLTLWCYSYSHSIVNHIETTYPGTFAKVFEVAHPHAPLSTEAFIEVLDGIIEDDMKKFFWNIGFIWR